MKIDTSGIQDFLERPRSSQETSPRAVANNEQDTSQVDFAAVIDAAMQPPQTDSDVLEQARELLESGQLESEQNIRAAAEDIIKFGI
jgi:hypothetical protein